MGSYTELFTGSDKVYDNNKDRNFIIYPLYGYNSNEIFVPVSLLKLCFNTFSR